MTALLKVIRGYVWIRVWGKGIERFFNLCGNKGILLWDIVQKEDGYHLCISLRNFYRLRPIVRKTGTRVVITKRVGLPFLMPVMWRRKVFLLGMLLCLVFWTMSSYYVWSIECVGNLQVTEDQLLSFLRDNQVAIGVRKSNLNIGELEKQIRREFPMITWTSARLEGTKLTVEVKENDALGGGTEGEREDRSDCFKGTDLISEYEGIVVSMIVRSGVPKVVIGDAVSAGTVLVEGRVPAFREDGTVKSYTYVEADADIVIQHQLTVQESLPERYIRRVYTGREISGHVMRLGQRELKTITKAPFRYYDIVVRESTPDYLKSFSIPLRFGHILCREYQNTECLYTDIEAKELLTAKINKFFVGLEEKGVHIIEKDVKIEVCGEDYIMDANLKVEELAAGRQDTSREEMTNDGSIK